MRGLQPARPGLLAARAFLASAALLAASSALGAPRATPDDDIALAIPRLSTPGGTIALPRPLDIATARRLRAAFLDAAAPLDGLQDTILYGHAVAARALLPTAHPALDDLRAWLARFVDQPDAPAMHALLLARLPRGGKAPSPPDLPPFTAALAGDDVEVGGTPLRRNPLLDRTVRDAARAGQADRALHLIARTRGLSAEYGALLRAEVAQSLFSQGRDLEALRVAEAANRQARGALALPPWISALAAWRLGRPELARTWFEATYRAPHASAGRRAAAAFWAARAALLTRGDHGPWMRRAAQEPRTFYGLLARRVLGQRITPPPAGEEVLTEADVDALAATPRGDRAFALLQVGQPARAAAELRLLWTETREQPGFGRSILVVARAAGLADVAQQLESVIHPATVHLPAARLRPAGGFRFNPALVYALTRLESNFDAAAVSPAGARGLMQIMPGTALAASRRGTPNLHDPATNLDLGQRYLTRLMAFDVVGSDLIRLLAGYNAGPGKLVRWTETMQREDDPLLFIEALPGAETRDYVARAMTYLWLYAAQLRQPSTSLDELAAGQWPTVPLRTSSRG